MAATEEPITVRDLRDRLRLNTDEDDERLADIIVDARLYVERVMGISIIPQTRVQVFEDERVRGQISGPIGRRPEMRLDYPPVTEVTKVEEYDAWADAWVEVTTGDWTYEPETRTILVRTWPIAMWTPSGLCRVTYTAGYAHRADVPIDVKQAVRRVAVWSYDRPSGSQPPDLSVTQKHYL